MESHDEEYILKNSKVTLSFVHGFQHLELFSMWLPLEYPFKIVRLDLQENWRFHLVRKICSLFSCVQNSPEFCRGHRGVKPSVTSLRVLEGF